MMLQTPLTQRLPFSDEENTELVPPSDPRSGVVSIDPERVSGAPCFAGTRVPIRNLLDYLIGGETLDTFLDDFVGVPREKAIAVLHLAFDRLLDGLPDA